MTKLNMKPVGFQKKTRGKTFQNITSSRAGQVVPVAWHMLLREDRIARGAVAVQVEMNETVRPLLNAVKVRAQAWLVPFLAFDRFHSLDQFNRSYMGQPDEPGGAVTPFFKTWPYGGDKAGVNVPPMGVLPNILPNVLYSLGEPYKDGDNVSDVLWQAYNAVYNHRLHLRSKHLNDLSPTNQFAQPAFWFHDQMSNVVPDYDNRILTGPIFAKPGKKPVHFGSYKPDLSPGFHGVQIDATHLADAGPVAGRFTAAQDFFVDINQNGGPITLADIQQARTTEAFARLRESYDGHSDDYIIDLLMQAVRVPEEMLKDPILLGSNTQQIGMTERFATDSAALEKSVTTGRTTVPLTIATPPVNTGGVLLITVEIVPDQLFERQSDVGLDVLTVAELPNRERDELDLDKIDVLKNSAVDRDHSSPDGAFGYVPLNARWSQNHPRVGGKFHRPVFDATFSENRQRFWSVEYKDPALTKDFYVCTGAFPQTPFADQVEDPFEIVTVGQLELQGNTLQGPAINEDVGAYQDVQDAKPN